MFHPQRAIGLKSATGQDHCIRAQMLLANLHTADAASLCDQIGYRTVVTDRPPKPLNSRQFHIKQTNALILCRQCQTAPKDMSSLFFKTLPAVDGLKFDTMRGQPAHGRAGLMDQHLLLFGQGAPGVKSQQIIGKFLGRIAAKICIFHPWIIWIAQQRHQIVSPIIGKPHRPRGVFRIATRQEFIGLFQQSNLGTIFQSGERCAKRGISSSNNDNRF